MAKGFTFKQFHIDAALCGMPVSTDGVLLGAWANISNAQSILDIGCGTGLLSIMCAQRNKKAFITGIDIEENAVGAATDNSEQSPWSDRITIKNSSLQDFVTNVQTFSNIICNPPYFNSGEEALLSQRALARHTSGLSHQTLLNACSDLLITGGTASFILPKVEGMNFIALLDSCDIISSNVLKLSRLTLVKTRQDKQPTRLLIEITKSLLPEPKVADSKITDSKTTLSQIPDPQINTALATMASKHETQFEILTINEGNGYSKEFISLTKDFYLKM